MTPELEQALERIRAILTSGPYDPTLADDLALIGAMARATFLAASKGKGVVVATLSMDLFRNRQFKEALEGAIAQSFKSVGDRWVTVPEGVTFEVFRSDVRDYDEAMERLGGDAHRYRLLKDLLIEAGCPWEVGCHVPTVVKSWLDNLKEKR